MKTSHYLSKKTSTQAGAVFLALLLSACGGSGDAAPETTTTPAATPTPTPAPEPTPVPVPIPTPTPTPTPVACPPPGAVLATRFSTVYKGCIAGVHTHYEKTECVKDSTTGLTWQGQTLAGSGDLRASDKVFTNLDSVLGTQNYNNNTPIAATTNQIIAGTNSLGFQVQINASSLCGKNNWRVPTRAELITLVDAGRLSPAIDTTWFPNTANAVYWTSTPYTPVPPNLARDWLANAVDFDFAGNNNSSYSDYRIGGNASSARIRVRLVSN